MEANKQDFVVWLTREWILVILQNVWQPTDLLDICTLVSLGAISILSFPLSLFLRRHSCFVTARQKFTVSIHDHKQLVTCLITVTRVQEMLERDWAFRSADDVDLFLLGASVWLNKSFGLRGCSCALQHTWSLDFDTFPTTFDYEPIISRRLSEDRAVVSNIAWRF